MSWVAHFLDTNDLTQLNQDVLTKVVHGIWSYAMEAESKKKGSLIYLLAFKAILCESNFRRRLNEVLTQKQLN